MQDGNLRPRRALETSPLKWRALLLGVGALLLVWSIWSVPVEGKWQGLLLIQQTQRPDRRAVSLRAVSSEADSSMTGTMVMPYFPR